MKLVIIDDEADARTTLSSFLNTYCPDINIVGEAEDVPSGVALIRGIEPEIVLLDIHLGEFSGFDLLDKFTNPNFRIIFITAFNQYALKAFEYCALDYLLKPIDPDRLIKAIDKAKSNIIKDQTFLQQINSLQKIHRNKSFEKIALPSSEGLVFLGVENIIYLKSDINYTLFYTDKNEKIIVSKTLKDFEAILPKDNFCRVHQSYMVNLKFVKKYLKEDGGYALMENKDKVPISRRKKEYFLKLLMA